MAPLTKRESTDSDMSEKSSAKRNKHEKALSLLPDEVLETIVSRLPIKDSVSSSVISRRFLRSWSLCSDLDFGEAFGNSLSDEERVDIVRKVMESNKAEKIDRLVLDLSHLGAQDMIEQWVLTCIEKKLEELDLSFEQGLQVMSPNRIDFSAIQTLRILKLSACAFDMPDNAKGLKFLGTLALTNTNVSDRLIASIFKNCPLLANFELGACYNLRDPVINARENTRFKSLIIACCPKINCIKVNAPSLRSFQYSGDVTDFDFEDTNALKDVMLHIFKEKLRFTPFHQMNRIFTSAGIEVFTASAVFLETIAWRFIQRNFFQFPTSFHSLKEVQLFMEGQSFSNLYEIASFIQNCPRVERVFIDLNNFMFEPGLYWETFQKPQLLTIPYHFDNLRFLEIKGFKNHWHELDIVQFFLEKSPNIVEIALVSPKRALKPLKKSLCESNHDRLLSLWTMRPWVRTVIYDPARYRPSFYPTHTKRCFH